ncbi:MAG TPA: ATP-dependent DNA helicase [Candidatus Limiplasma pullicola]|nr:ATP-dependent DNA helicase [Candidatus Limiplasma pullicola]
MGETFRVSVRELVAFSYFPPDITPAEDAERMLAGGRAHRARQAGAAGESEKSLCHAFSCLGADVTVYGRMDLFEDGDVPFVEEIKLGAQARFEPLPEHWAQAVCYGAMLAREKPCERVRLCVCYVDEAGEALSRHEETLDRDALVTALQNLLEPWTACALRESAYRRDRDASLRALAFPYESYRKGQRELAVQVYTAIRRKKRLFASLPTGTGKSAAVLYPALKALGEGLTGKVLYLTARNTARQSPVHALERMYRKGLRARCTVLTAKEKLCPAPTRCHPDFCPRAKGHYLRQGDAVDELLACRDVVWTDERIHRAAEHHDVCPFELALALVELADVVLMDLNYAFDPFAQVKRLFQRRRDMTLLVDEAHHAVERVRDSLSGSLDSRELARLRAEHGKQAGRKTPYYRALTALIRALRELGGQEERSFERTLDTLPEGIAQRAEEAFGLAVQQLAQGEGAADAARMLMGFRYAAEHLDEDYAVLLEGRGRERTLTLYCLLPGREIARVTRGLRGAVFFSATLTPLPAMKRLLGGEEADACFSLPSPFDPRHLQVVRRRVNTGYERRESTAEQIADALRELTAARPGSYIAYFPSYAYLSLVLERLKGAENLPPLLVQRRDMEGDEQAAFLEAFEKEKGAKLGLCVLGGLYSEGIDLPGERLIGAAVVGMGLPVPSARLAAVRACYQRHFGDGFAYACRIPGMHKVLQAAGRVVRSESDRGIVLLLDDRYYDPAYAALLPDSWQLCDEDISLAAQRLEETACKEGGEG